MSKESEIDAATERLFALIVRTRFRCPGTSSDPYIDTLTMWMTVVAEVREVLASLENAVDIRDVETIYRDAVGAWLRGDSPTEPWMGEEAGDTAQIFADEEIQHRIRQVLDPPAVWIA